MPSEHSYDSGNNGKNHLYVIIDAEKNEVIEAEYFGMIVSSHREKGKDVSKFKFNEPLSKNDKNGLKEDSIVKCDQIFSIPYKYIQFKIGRVDITDYLKFMEIYLNSLENK